MNTESMKHFTQEEVELALQQMAPMKPLGPNDFNLGFYKTYWHIVGDEVTSVVLKFLNNDIFYRCINFT